MGENPQNSMSKSKKPIFKKWWFWLIAVVIIGAIASSSQNNNGTKVGETSPSSQANEQTVFKAGDTIAFDGKEVTVSEAERHWNSGNQFITAGSGKEYVKVEITIKNNSDSEISYNTFDWELQDSSGDIQNVTAATFGVDGALGSGNLASGGTKSGFLVFEVPEGDAGLTLRYNPSFWSSKKLEIEL